MSLLSPSSDPPPAEIGKPHATPPRVLIGDLSSRAVPLLLSVHSFTPALMSAGSARPWHAEVCADGEARPLRFENPMDLLSFLSRPSGTPTTTRGLR